MGRLHRPRVRRRAAGRSATSSRCTRPVAASSTGPISATARSVPGIDTDELEILADVLGGDEPALAAACARAGELVGSGGRIAVGEPADLVWLPSYERLRDLGSRKDVFIDGKLIA